METSAYELRLDVDPVLHMRVVITSTFQHLTGLVSVYANHLQMLYMPLWLSIRLPEAVTAAVNGSRRLQ